MDLILILFPAFLIFSSGYIGQKIFKFDVKSISTMALYLMMPFLVFETFYTHEINSDYLYIFFYTLLFTLLLIGITIFIGKINKVNKSQMSALLLGGIFPNSGNYGAPVALFAFGPLAFNYAVIIMVIHSFLINTIGIIIATFGSKKSTNIKVMLINVLKIPVSYSAILGILLQFIHYKIPQTIINGISLIGSATIPTVMLILGMQLAEIKFERLEKKYINIIIIIRMVLSPLIAICLINYMPVSDTIKYVFVLLGAMPVAANITMLAVQFEVESDLISFSTLVTTIISLFSIPLTIYFLSQYV